MTDRAQVAARQKYELDDRAHFCRHCGRAAWRHEIMGGKRICHAILKENDYDKS